QNTIHAADCVADFVVQSFGRGVQQSIKGALAESYTHPQNDRGNTQGGECVRICKPGEIPVVAGPNERDAEDHHDGAPHVGGEVQGVGFQSFAGVFFGDGIESASASDVDAQSDEQDDNGKEARLDVNAVE